MSIYRNYKAAFSALAENNRIVLQKPPQETGCNAHMFYMKVKNLAQRSRPVEFLRLREIIAPFHYVPLHSSSAGKNLGRFHGIDRYTTTESERLVRVPLFYNMTECRQAKVVEAVIDFFNGEGSS